MSNWVKISDEIPDVFAEAFMIKNEKEEILKAYFYSDKMQWIAFYGKKPTYWWNARTHEPIYNATEWLKK